MKNTIRILLIFFITFNLLGVVYADNMLSKPPRIVFKKSTHNFGKVNKDTELNFTFKFTNKGSGTLTIDNVQSSCGCLITSMEEKKDFAKNESGEIKVKFSTQGRSGHQEKVIIVHSNDPTTPHKVLKIICDIEE